MSLENVQMLENSMKSVDPAVQKREEWLQKSNKRLISTVLKIAAITFATFALIAGAAAYLFALAHASTPSPIQLAAIKVSLSVFIISGLAAAALFGVSYLIDPNNYYLNGPKNEPSLDFVRFPGEAQKELDNVRNSEKPIPLKKFEALHDVGVITANELEARKKLEEDAKKYCHLERKIKQFQDQINIDEKYLENSAAIDGDQAVYGPSGLKVTSRKEIERNLAVLKENEEKLIEEFDGVKKIIVDYHQSIIDFDPKSAPIGYQITSCLSSMKQRIQQIKIPKFSVPLSC